MRTSSTYKFYGLITGVDNYSMQNAMAHKYTGT